jgi:hypothetical protein
MLLPIAVGVDLIHEDGTVLATVAAQISLSIAVDVQPADQATSLHRSFPDPGVDGGVAPGHVEREANVHSQEPRHHRPQPTKSPTATRSRQITTEV